MLTPLPTWFFALAAAGLEGLLIWVRPALPLYRRHLLVFSGVGVAALVLTASWGAWFMACGAAALGLALPSLRWVRGRRLGGLSWQRGTPHRQDPGRPLILVADAHWGDDLTGLDAATSAHPEADWLFLGDLFDWWVGLDHFQTPVQRRFLAWVDDRRRAGRWVGLWLGNREFFLDGLAGRFDLMGEGVGGSLPEEGLTWEHGDFVDGRLWTYRLMNLLVRSGPMWLLCYLLPAPMGRRMAQRLRTALAVRPRQQGVPVPLKALEAAAIRAGGRVFMTGHFHQQAKSGNAFALPWAHEGQFMVWQGGDVRPLPGLIPEGEPTDRELHS